MKPETMHRPRCATPPAGLAFALLFFVASAWAAPLPEPALQAATELSAHVQVTDAERALLRVEYHAAQSAQNEADIVSDIIARTQRIEEMVADIQHLVSAWSPNPAAVAPSATLTQEAAAPASGSDAPSLKRYGMIALAAALGCIVWLMHKRHVFLLAKQRRAVTHAAQALQAEAVQATPAAVPGPAPLAEPTARPEALPPRPVAPPISLSAPSTTPRMATPASLNFDLDEEGAATGETDQAVELADIMMSMGLTAGAAQTLSDQVHGHPKQALFHWLKLLDIYRRSNMRWDFEQAARDMRMYFNVQAPGWGTESSAISIEDYPHLAEQLQSLWPGTECVEFLARLLHDNRGGSRNGFPQSVAEEILLLQQILAADEPVLAFA